jgi:hypothetical protein
LSGFDVRADIGVPRMQVTGNARIDGRIDVRGEAPRQHERLRSGTGLRQHRSNGGNGLRIGPRGEFLVRMNAAEHAAGHDAGRHHQRDGCGGFEVAQRLRRSNVDFSRHGILPFQGQVGPWMIRSARDRRDGACRSDARG